MRTNHCSLFRRALPVVVLIAVVAGALWIGGPALADAPTNESVAK